MKMVGAPELERRNLRRTIYPVAAVLIVIVASTLLLRPAEAAPTGHSTDFDSWWYNACGHHGVRHTSRDTCANLSSFVPRKTKAQVRNQMKIFLGTFQKEYKSINNTYAQVLKGFTTYTQPAFDWLPTFKRPTKKSITVLPKYHKDLQKFVVAVHYLTTIKLETEAEFKRKNQRDEQLKKMSNNMKGLLCEIETAVNATCQLVPERIPASFAQDHGLKQVLHDLTDLYLVDHGILSLFHTFIKKSSKLAQFLPLEKESDGDDDEEIAALSAEAGGE